MSRTLFVIPIIHSEADLGRLAGTLRTAAGGDKWAAKQQAVRRLWGRISEWCDSIDPTRLFVFQDALPDHPTAPQIVAELADQGSPNYRVISRLVERGAVLVGTERPELLLREYEQACAAARSIEDGMATRRADGGDAAALLELRDCAIADKIGSTLGNGDRGVLFIGLMHDVTSRLAQDIDPVFPLGRGDRTGVGGAE
ncbi:MAG: hypothetical protein AAF937_01815 [Planctomycetota bacterium]